MKNFRLCGWNYFYFVTFLSLSFVMITLHRADEIFASEISLTERRILSYGNTALQPTDENI